MHRMLAFVTSLLVGISLVLTDGMSASMRDQATVDRSMVWLAGSGAIEPLKKAGKKKKPPVKQPVPSAAARATEGQTGKCICSTNAAGSMMCTGDCR